MEARKITVVSTKGTGKVVIMSEAETLGQLKSDLAAQNVDFDGMTFYEGISKTELNADDAILPHDVPYKGATTNELVFMLTNTNKKIRSGAMTRSEAYDAIKAIGLQDACVEKYGKNFTLCKTTELEALINENAITLEVGESTNVQSALECLVEILCNVGAIDASDKETVYSALDGKIPSPRKREEKSPYSDADIDAMFKDMQ